jgi:predicted ABC-type transport system involved in lysophospholipase L1 biosynthesis ATPase subunit
VTRDFGSGDAVTRALRGVELEIPHGELLMLVGPSGCGKTTLVSIIAGTLQPTGGEVQVLGQDLVTMSPAARVRFRRANVGFIFQSFNLLPALTAVENAAVPLIIAGWSRAGNNDAIGTGGGGARLRGPRCGRDRKPWMAGLRPPWRLRVNINADEYYYRRHGYQFTPGSAFRRYLAF